MRKIWIYAICGLGLILGATQLQAQPLVPGPSLQLSEVFGFKEQATIVGDPNGDGIADIFVGNAVIFIGDGSFSYSPVRLDISGGPFLLADIDGDGLDDILSVESSSGGLLKVLIGSPDNDFQRAPFSPIPAQGGIEMLEVADVDNNGTLDLITITNAGSIEALMNNGNGTFDPVISSISAENLRLSTTADINNDGFVDLAIVDPFLRPNTIRLLLGDGAGSFIEAPDSPLTFNNQTSGAFSRARTIEFADMNGDGNQDLIGSSSSPAAVAVFMGAGDGTFSEVPDSPFFYTNSDADRPDRIAIGDVNLDGVLDVVSSNLFTVSVLAGIGDGRLSEISESPFPVGSSAGGTIDLRDLDGDLDLDVVTSNGITVAIGEGLGDGAFVPAKTSPLLLDAGENSIHLEDLNGNGKNDLAYLRSGPGSFALRTGLNEGRFGNPQSTLLGDGSRPESMAFGDLNDDGHSDAVIGLRETNDRPPDTENGDISILLGDGVGSFTKINQAGLPEDSGTIDVAITEFDGNTPPDLFVRTGSGVRLFSGNGDGTFSDFGLVDFPSAAIPLEVLSVDINNDGFQDIAASWQFSQDIKVFLGSAAGTFEEASFSPLFASDTGLGQISSADFNGDGSVDFVGGEIGFSGDVGVTVLINDGGGNFSRTSYFPFQGSGFTQVAVLDFDDDSDLDILAVRGDRYQFMENDGSGDLTPDPSGPFFSRNGGFNVEAVAQNVDNDTAEDALLLNVDFESDYRITSLLSTRPTMQLAPASIEFPDTELGMISEPVLLSVGNQGDRSLDITDLGILGGDESQFILLSEGCVGSLVLPGESCTAQLAFSPTQAGLLTSSLELVSNAQSSPDLVTLNGTSIVGDQPILALNPEVVSFGDVAIGDSRNRMTTIENTGTTTLELGDLALSGSAAGDYTLNVDNCSSTTLEPAQTCSFNVGVAPTQTGLRDASVEIPSNAFSSPDQQPYSATGIEAPVITFVPDGFDFGQVAVGTTEISPDLLVENSGSADLVIDELQLQGTDAPEFDLASDECSGQVLPIGAQCVFTVSFSPTAVGFNGPAVAVISNAFPSARFFLMSGEGVLGNPELDLMPDSIDFGNVAGDGGSDAASVTFSNPGIGPLEVTAFDPAETPFIQVGGSCGAVPFSVPAGDSCTIDYQFQPIDPGDFAQTITVDSDAIAGSDTEFSLTGTSGQFDVAVMKSNAAEFVLSGVPTIYDIQVLNLGLSDLFGVEIVDILPPELDATSATWTCTPGTGVTCPIDSGVGDINELVDIPAGAGMAFTLVAPVIAEEGVDVVNTVTATMPAGIEDEDPSNNEATDSDPVAIFAGDFEFAGCSDDLIENRFCVTGENVVLDIVTGLEWQRCPFGRVWDETNQTCTGDASGVEWDDAVLLAPDGGWRLPSVEELSTLRYCSDGDPALFLPSVSGPGIRCNNVGDIIQPVIEPEAFPNWPLNAPVGPPWFWTTTDGPDFEDSDGNIIDGKIAVSFGEGSILNVNKVSPIQVLLVRD